MLSLLFASSFSVISKNSAVENTVLIFLGMTSISTKTGALSLCSILAISMNLYILNTLTYSGTFAGCPAHLFDPAKSHWCFLKASSSLPSSLCWLIPILVDISSLHPLRFVVCWEFGMDLALNGLWWEEPVMLRLPGCTEMSMAFL